MFIEILQVQGISLRLRLERLWVLAEYPALKAFETRGWVALRREGRGTAWLLTGIILRLLHALYGRHFGKIDRPQTTCWYCRAVLQQDAPGYTHVHFWVSNTLAPCVPPI